MIHDADSREVWADSDIDDDDEISVSGIFLNKKFINYLKKIDLKKNLLSSCSYAAQQTQTKKSLHVQILSHQTASPFPFYAIIPKDEGPLLNKNIKIWHKSNQALLLGNKSHYFYDWECGKSIKLQCTTDSLPINFSIHPAHTYVALIHYHNKYRLWLHICTLPHSDKKPLTFHGYVDCMWINNNLLLLLAYDFKTHIFNAEKEVIKELIPLDFKSFSHINKKLNTIYGINRFGKEISYDIDDICNYESLANITTMHNKWNYFELLDDLYVDAL